MYVNFLNLKMLDLFNFGFENWEKTTLNEFLAIIDVYRVLSIFCIFLKLILIKYISYYQII